jgi:hypothetical protein
MPNVLLTQYYHDDFQIFGETFVGAITSGTAFFYADRDIVIDSITFGVSVVGGASATLQVVKTTTGTLASPASALAATIAAGTGLHTAQSITTGGTYVQTLTTPSSDTNLIKAGNWIGLAVGGTIGTPAVNVQIRFRSRLN